MLSSSKKIILMHILFSQFNHARITIDLLMFERRVFGFKHPEILMTRKYGLSSSTVFNKEKNI